MPEREQHGHWSGDGRKQVSAGEGRSETSREGASRTLHSCEKIRWGENIFAVDHRAYGSVITEQGIHVQLPKGITIICNKL